MSDLNLKPEGDHVVRALAMDGRVRLTAIRSTETVSKARLLHGLSPLATVALGRFMSGLQLLAMDLKNDTDQITGILRCAGELGGMTAVADHLTRVRGFVKNPAVPAYFRSPEKFDVAKAVGEGSLTIIRAQAGAKPYSGTVPLISGEIAEDLTYYLAYSEQIPTILGLGVLCDKDGVRHAGGYLIQPMPEAGDDVLDYLEKRAGGFPNLTFLMEEGFTPAQILDLFMGDPGIQYLEVKPTSYFCPCSKERMAQALTTLQKADLDEIAADGKGADLHCEFCESLYHFTPEEISEIAAKARG